MVLQHEQVSGKPIASAKKMQWRMMNVFKIKETTSQHAHKADRAPSPGVRMSSSRSTLIAPRALREEKQTQMPKQRRNTRKTHGTASETQVHESFE